LLHVNASGKQYMTSANVLRLDAAHREFSNGTPTVNGLRMENDAKQK
jgi:hypothetical protein